MADGINPGDVIGLAEFNQIGKAQGKERQLQGGAAGQQETGQQKNHQGPEGQGPEWWGSKRQGAV